MTGQANDRRGSIVRFSAYHRYLEGSKAAIEQAGAMDIHKRLVDSIMEKVNQADQPINGHDEQKVRVVDYLKQLAQAVESGQVAVRSIDSDCVQDQHRLGLVEYVWRPEIQFLVMSPETRELFLSLQFFPIER